MMEIYPPTALLASCSCNPSSRQIFLTRAQLKLDEGAFPTNACGLHKKKQVMDAQSPQGFAIATFVEYACDL